MNSPSPDRADQVRGGFRVIDDFMTATESLFERLYRSLSRRRRTIVDTEKLLKASAQTKALQQRVRSQNIELARMAGVLAAIDEGIIMQDTQGRIVLMNEAARRMLGGVRNFWDSPLGQMFKEHVTNRPNPTVAGLIDPLSEPQRVEVNDNLLAASLAGVYSAQQGEPLGTVMVLADISNHALADKLKTSFITQMSHELLTPLTSIKGMSDLLINTAEGAEPNRRFLEAISRNVAIMDRMIVELLDIAEIDAGNFTIKQEPISLDNEIEYVLQGLEPRLRKANLKVTLHVINKDYLDVIGDQRRMRWALGHLIDNAINYTPSGGKITIEVGRVRDKDVIIKVRDTGVGISDEDLPNIFDRFYRGKALKQDGTLIDPRGLGQGLYVAREVIEVHGGTISVASKLGEGSIFTIALPITK
jgi:two-component system sensor histidine kinase ResE